MGKIKQVFLVIIQALALIGLFLALGVGLGILYLMGVFHRIKRRIKNGNKSNKQGNNKKNYPTARQCRFYVRKKQKCSNPKQVWLNKEKTAYCDFCVLCNPKVYSCKNFEFKQIKEKNNGTSV